MKHQDAWKHPGCVPCLFYYDTIHFSVCEEQEETRSRWIQRSYRLTFVCFVFTVDSQHKHNHRTHLSRSSNASSPLVTPVGEWLTLSFLHSDSLWVWSGRTNNGTHRQHQLAAKEDGFWFHRFLNLPHFKTAQSKLTTLNTNALALEKIVLIIKIIQLKNHTPFKMTAHTEDVSFNNPLFLLGETWQKVWQTHCSIFSPKQTVSFLHFANHSTVFLLSLKRGGGWGGISVF